MSKIITDRHKLACYLLSSEFGVTQQKIADMFGVSQPAVHHAIKEAKYMVTIRQMGQELEAIREELRANGIDQPELFPGGIIDI